jgi:hypothetical protein
MILHVPIQKTKTSVSKAIRYHAVSVLLDCISLKRDTNVTFSNKCYSSYYDLYLISRNYLTFI